MIPRFTIIIPTYNRASFLTKAIESVMNQTFQNWELLIIDDGSTDNTKEIIGDYISKDSRIKYFYQENAERSAARNHGIDKARGEWICFLDSDDYYLENRLANLDSKLEKFPPKQGFFFTGIAYFNGEFFTKCDDYLNKELSIYDFLITKLIGTPQVIIKREFLLIEKFNTHLNIGEDLELWFRVSKLSEPEFIKDETTIVALEHEDRSVNIKKYNSSLNLLKTFKIIFDKSHPGYKVTDFQKSRVLSNTYFNIAKYHMFQGDIFKSIYLTVFSIFIDPKNSLTKHKVYCLSRLFFFKIPNDYNAII